MQIESPFGKIEVIFVRNNHCVLQCCGTQPIKINGVELSFRKDIIIIDGKWEMVECDGGGDFYISSNLNLKFNDWTRYNESPSKNAREKLHGWISDSFISNLMMGVYQNELNRAEIYYSKNKINALNSEIRAAEKVIEKCKAEIATLTHIINK